MGDWTKGGRWTKVTIYRYGADRDLFHLCFYNKDSFSIDAQEEFDITELSDSTDAICMIYPFVVKEVFESLTEAWCKAPSDYNNADWVAVSKGGKNGARIDIEPVSKAGRSLRESGGGL